MEPFGIIYKVVCISNWKGYVGQTIYPLERRIYLHLKEKHRGIFPRALRKYGLENFFWYIICECFSRKEMNEKEKYYINYFETKCPGGYNLTDGGNGVSGWIPSEEWRKNRSILMKSEKNPTRQPGVAKKVGDSIRGIPKSKEHRRKLSEASSGKNNYWYGKKRPDMSGENSPTKRPEVRKKISQALTGKKLLPRTKEHCENIGKTMSIIQKGKKRGPYKKK